MLCRETLKSGRHINKTNWTIWSIGLTFVWTNVQKDYSHFEQIFVQLNYFFFKFPFKKFLSIYFRLKSRTRDVILLFEG